PPRGRPAVTQRARASGKVMPWAKLDSEQRNTLLLYAGIAIVVIFALGLIGYGYYDSKIKPLHQTVLTVGTRKFDVGDLEQRMKSQLLTGQISASGTFRDVASSTLAAMQQEEILRQSADALGIQVTDADVDTGIKNAVGMLSDVPQDQFAT